MQTMALYYIYTIAGLQLFGVLVFLGKNHLTTKREAVISIVLNTLEAAAIFYLWHHSTFEFATPIATLLWVSEAALIVRSIRRVGSTTLFTPRRMIWEVAMTAATVFAAYLLAFA